MIFIIITYLITILSLFGLLRALKEKNFLAIVFSLIATGLFGWFSIMETFFKNVA